MKEVENFEVNFNNNKYIITIYSIQFNHLTAYFAVAHDEFISQRFFYKDHNEMVYYFTHIEDLKSRLDLFLHSLNGNISETIKDSN